MIIFKKTFLTIFLLLSTFTTVFSANTGDLILDGNFSALQTQNYIDILVFVIILVLILTILQETLGNKLPISPIAFKSASLALMLSFLWVLFSNFGSVTFALIIGTLAELTIILAGIGVFFAIRKKEAFYSARTVFGFIGAIIFIMIVNTTIFNNFTRINGTFLETFIQTLSFQSGGSILLLVGLILIGFFSIGFKDKKNFGSPINKIHQNKEKISKFKEDFLRHFTVLNQELNQLIKDKVNPIEETTKKKLVSSTISSLNTLLSITSKKIDSEHKFANWTGNNPFSKQEIIQKLSSLVAIIQSIQRDNYQTNETTIKQIISEYTILDSEIKKILSNTDLRLQDLTHIEQILGEFSGQLNKFDNNLGSSIKKTFNSEIKNQLEEIYLNELINQNGNNEAEEKVRDKFTKVTQDLIDTSTGLERTPSTAQINDLPKSFKVALLQQDSYLFWEEHWNIPKKVSQKTNSNISNSLNNSKSIDFRDCENIDVDSLLEYIKINQGKTFSDFFKISHEGKIKVLINILSSEFQKRKLKLQSNGLDYSKEDTVIKFIKYCDTEVKKNTIIGKINFK